MDQTYCYYCMNPLKGQTVCPVCGTPVGTTGTSEHKTFYLMPGSTLHSGRYLLGRVLGAGGFGITYIGLDTVLRLRVAIKEYFLMNYATRFPTDPNVVMHSTSSMQLFDQGKERFLYEARILASMDKVPVIVGVKDFFEENGTAYIVMEFIQGTTLKELVYQKGGRILPEELFPLMEPLFRNMVQVHQKGLIHRDIAPDNLMLENGVIRLLDFGCAREAITGTETMTIMLKPGFAPMEQYDGRGQGPWTDIYALCATIYFCLTGEIPPPAIYRFRNDTLKAPSKLGVRLLPETEQALLQGMAVEPEHRCSSVAELYSAIFGELRRHGHQEERERWASEEAERRRKETEEAEREFKEAERRFKEAERKLKETTEARHERKEAEEAERRRREEERKLKEAKEAERKRREAEEAGHRFKEAEEAERKRKEAEETERKRKESKEAERKPKAVEEAKPEQRKGQTPWWKRYAVPLGICACLIAVFLIVMPRRSETHYEQNTAAVAQAAPAAQSEASQQATVSVTHNEKNCPSGSVRGITAGDCQRNTR